MIDLYSLPTGVRLDTDELQTALSAVRITVSSYRANGCSNYQFRDTYTGAALHVVESEPGQPRHLTEVVGDTALWCLVRAVAVDIASAEALAA